MSEAAILPTRRDEAWRYSDTDALAGIDLGNWRAVDVAPGETLRETLVIEDENGNADGTRLTRLRVSIGKRAPYELFGVIASAHLGRV